MDALRRFYAEMEYVEYLHLGTLYAYNQAAIKAVQDIDSGLRSPTDPITRTISPNYKYNRVARNIAVLERKLKTEFPKHLREILFVRVISILEVFLVDAVREIFIARKDLFQRDEKVELSYAQLLSFHSVSEIATHLINKECRTLQNVGFRKLTAYFKQRLGIDFSKFSGGIAKIEEFYDRRHMLVHRLGRTDAKYRRDYNTRQSRITIERRYLIDCFENIRSFADFLVIAANDIIQQGKNKSQSRTPTSIVEVRVQALSQKGEAIINPDHTFAFDDQILSVRDVLHSHIQESDGVYVLKLQGQFKHVHEYIRYLKRLKGEDTLNFLDVKYIRRIGPRKQHLPNDFLEAVAATLPKQPWPADIHEKVAEKFGITKKQARRALTRIKLWVSDEIFQQIEQVVPAEPWVIGLHREIAQQFNITEHQARLVLQRIRQMKNADYDGEDTSTIILDS